MSVRFSVKLLHFLRHPRNNCSIRNYSRRINNNNSSDNSSYKTVKSRSSIQENSNLVWRDPNFELLATHDGSFPLFLPGHIGLAWYDTQTTIKTHHELIMEQIDEKSDRVSTGNIICRVQSCPTVLRKSVCDLFPNRGLDNAELSVITITLKPDFKLMRKNSEIETERMAQLFLIAAKNVCDKLRSAGYWADFINPFSGLPYLSPSSNNGKELYETDERFRCLDFQIFEIKDCKVISNDDTAKKRFIGSLFTTAPCKKNHLNSIFTQKDEELI